MKRNDLIHPLLEKLWSRAMKDKDASYKPHSVRIDREGLMLLRMERGPFNDGSFDPHHADGLKFWRKLPFIMEYKSSARFEPITEEAVLIVPLTLCVEARQSGESGRRKYYDATDEELAEIRAKLEATSAS